MRPGREEEIEIAMGFGRRIKDYVAKYRKAVQELEQENNQLRELLFSKDTFGIDSQVLEGMLSSLDLVSGRLLVNAKPDRDSEFLDALYDLLRFQSRDDITKFIDSRRKK